MVSWTQKYAPQKRSEVIGNTTSVNSIIGYLNRFRNVKLRTESTKKALLLYGPPGIGKTSSVLAIANSLNFDVVIVNASDKRNKSSLQMVRNASQFSSLEESLNEKVVGQILLIDEVDGLSGTADRGGIREIIDIIKNTRVPIILTANNVSSQKFKSLLKICELSRFSAPQAHEILKILKRISKSESITVDDEVLMEIVEKSSYDIRGSINSLQTIGSGRKTIKSGDIAILSHRDQTIDIREFLHTLFIERNGNKANRQTRSLYDVDYNKLLLLLRDITARAIGYDNPALIADAYSLLAQADLALTRASRERIWSQLYYYYSYITKGLASILPDIDYLPPLQDWQLQVPQYWITLSRQRKGKNIASKIGRENKVSSFVAIRDIFPYLRIIFNNNPDMASDLAITYKLFDVEPGKRQTRIIWNKEIDYFAKNPAINKEIKALIRKKFPTLERIEKREVNAKELQEAQDMQQAMKKEYKKKKPASRKKKKKSRTTKKEKVSKKIPKERSKKKEKKNQTLVDFF